MANIPFPPITTPDQVAMNALDFAQFTNTANQYVGGTLGSLPIAFTTSGASANTILSASINPGFLAIGNTLRAKVVGVPTTGVADVITLNFGAASVTFTTPASALIYWCELDVVVTGAATQQLVSFGVSGVTPIQALQTTGAVSMAAAVAVSLTSTMASSTATIYTATLEMVR
jgi:hypothetical protein